MNEPLPSDIFKLAGMDIPPDTRVTALSPPGGLGYYIWDGKKIELIDGHPDVPRASSNRRKVLLGISIVCAVIAAALCCRDYYRRKEANPGNDTP